MPEHARIRMRGEIDEHARRDRRAARRLAGRRRSRRSGRGLVLLPHAHCGDASASARPPRFTASRRARSCRRGRPRSSCGCPRGARVPRGDRARAGARCHRRARAVPSGAWISSQPSFSPSVAPGGNIGVKYIDRRLDDRCDGRRRLRPVPERPRRAPRRHAIARRRDARANEASSAARLRLAATLRELRCDARATDDSGVSDFGRIGFGRGFALRSGFVSGFLPAASSSSRSRLRSVRALELERGWRRREVRAPSASRAWLRRRIRCPSCRRAAQRARPAGSTNADEARSAR